MPIHINSPGGKSDGPERSRCRANDRPGSDPSLPSEFLTRDSRVVEEVVVEPAAPGAQSRAVPAAPVLDLSSTSSLGAPPYSPFAIRPAR